MSSGCAELFDPVLHFQTRNPPELAFIIRDECQPCSFGMSGNPEIVVVQAEPARFGRAADPAVDVSGCRGNWFARECGEEPLRLRLQSPPAASSWKPLRP